VNLQPEAAVNVGLGSLFGTASSAFATPTSSTFAVSSPSTWTLAGFTSW